MQKVSIPIDVAFISRQATTKTDIGISTLPPFIQLVRYTAGTRNFIQIVYFIVIGRVVIDRSYSATSQRPLDTINLILRIVLELLDFFGHVSSKILVRHSEAKAGNGQTED